MTLIGSFILTSQFGFFVNDSIRFDFVRYSMNLGGVYWGFSCFDCCGRWKWRRTTLKQFVLPEVSKRFLPQTIRYHLLLNETKSDVRGAKNRTSDASLLLLLLGEFLFFDFDFSSRILDVESRRKIRTATTSDFGKENRILSNDFRFVRSILSELHSECFEFVYRRIRFTTESNENSSKFDRRSTNNSELRND